MLVTVEPNVSVLPALVSVPAALRPLVEAANAGHTLHGPMRQIMEAMGFGSFMYGVATGQTLHRDERFFIWTTVPSAWVVEYDRNSYVEIDPRVTYAWTTLSPPLIWDRRIANGNAKVESFLERAAAHGIGSGLAVFLHDYHSRVLVCLNQADRTLTARRRRQISKVMGDAMQLASIFHLIFMKSVIEKGIPPIQEGSPLSARERQCLHLAARGMVSPDIGHKLNITERTVNFHFSNIISKLGVLNRHEAIAMGVAHGLIQVDRRNTPLVPLHPSRIRDAQLKRWENLRKQRGSPASES
jgi:DNA-binding CsgD family transcriptional regulator